jgi:hypothetical protein
MRKLSILLVAALLIIISTKTAKADIELDIHCGCQSPTPTSSPTPTVSPSPTPILTQTPTPPNGQVGAPICTATMPDPTNLVSVVRKGTSATLTWTKVNNANNYLIFYGTASGSHEFGVPQTGNVTSYTINFLDPNRKYYFEVRSINDCMPSGEVLGVSTSVLGATSSNLLMPRISLAIITAGGAFYLVKKFIV